jgi:hypothetical protein
MIVTSERADPLALARANPSTVQRMTQRLSKLDAVRFSPKPVNLSGLPTPCENSAAAGGYLVPADYDTGRPIPPPPPAPPHPNPPPSPPPPPPPSPSPPLPLPSHNCTFEENIGFHNEWKVVKPVPDVFICCGICHAYTGCVASVFAKPVCFLFRDISQKLQNRTGRTACIMPNATAQASRGTRFLGSVGL